MEIQLNPYSTNVKQKQEFDFNAILNIPDNYENVSVELNCMPLLLQISPNILLDEMNSWNLLHSECLPYILRKGCCVKYRAGYENIGKHDIDMRRIFEKLDAIRICPNFEAILS